MQFYLHQNELHGNRDYQFNLYESANTLRPQLNNCFPIKSNILRLRLIINSMNQLPAANSGS